MVLELNTNMMLLALVALFLDALFGSHRLLGRLPGPDSLIRVSLGGATSYLDGRATRPVTAAALGTLLLVLAISLAAALGYLVDRLDAGHPAIQGGQILLLALVLGQRAVVGTARHLAGRLDRAAQFETEGRYAAARWTIERLTNRFADGLVANLIWFIAGGFAGLLAFRALSIFAALGSGDGVRTPQRPHFFVAGGFYWILGIFPGLVASMLLVLAGLVATPGKVLSGLGFLRSDLRNALPLRLWPLRTMAGLLAVSLKVAPDDPSNSDWIGSKGARARVVATDVRRAMLIIVIAWLMVLAILGALLLRFLDV